MSAGYTYRQLIDEVISFQFSPGKYESLVKTWLNSAQQAAVLQTEFRTMEAKATYATEAGDDTLELPEDFARLIDFADTETPGLLNRVDLRELDTYAESTGRPVAYAVEGNTIALYPSPDGAYELALRYRRLPAEMVNDGDQPEIPAQYHDLLIAYAMQKAYLRENDYNAAKVWEVEWQSGIMKMRGEVNTDTADGPRQVPSMWGSQGVGPSYNFPR